MVHIRDDEDVAYAKSASHILFPGAAMSVSRRSFVATLGAGGVGILAGPLITWRGREAPANFAKFLGHPVISPPVDAKLQLDLDAMRDAARGAGLVYLCNANNPTATVHSKADVASFVDQVNRLSPDTVILVDEAYHEY